MPRMVSSDLDRLAEVIEKAWPPMSPIPAGPQGTVVSVLPELIAVAKAALGVKAALDTDGYMRATVVEDRAHSALDAKLKEVLGDQ